MAPLRIFVTGGTFDKEYDELAGNLFFGEPTSPRDARAGPLRVGRGSARLMMVDSLEMSDADRDLIVTSAASWRSPRIVITHGTDTMVETAAAGRERLGKTIVLTGAMIPFAFGSSDGLFNLGGALAFAQGLPAGVYVAMNGALRLGQCPQEPRHRGVRGNHGLAGWDTIMTNALPSRRRAVARRRAGRARRARRRQGGEEAARGVGAPASDRARPGAGDPADARSESTVTLAVLNAKVWTGDPAHPWAEALAAAGDRLVAVGTNDDVKSRADGPKVIDARGRVVTRAPSTLTSLPRRRRELASVQLRDATRGVLRERVGIRRHRAGRWLITGDNWTHTLWGGELPTKEWIDSVTPDRPVW